MALDADDLSFGAARLRPRLSRCLGASPAKLGRLTLLLHVHPNGSICGAQLGSVAPVSDGVSACVGRALRRYRFPRSATLSTVVVPLITTTGAVVD